MVTSHHLSAIAAGHVSTISWNFSHTPQVGGLNLVLIIELGTFGLLEVPFENFQKDIREKKVTKSLTNWQKLFKRPFS